MQRDDGISPSGGRTWSGVSCDSAGSLVYSAYSGPGCNNLTSTETFRPTSISSGGNCFKLPKKVFDSAAGIAFADCSSPTAVPALATENGAVLVGNERYPCPADGSPLASLSSSRDEILVAFPRAVPTLCNPAPYSSWPNFQVDFNSNGKTGTLTGCLGTSSVSINLESAPSCSTASFTYTDSRGGVPTQRTDALTYQVIPAPFRLSGGAIAGITVGVLAACAIAGFFGYRYYRQKQQQSLASAQLAGRESLIGSASDVQYEPVSGAYVKMPATV